MVPMDFVLCILQAWYFLMIRAVTGKEKLDNLLPQMIFAMQGSDFQITSITMKVFHLHLYYYRVNYFLAQISDCSNSKESHKTCEGDLAGQRGHALPSVWKKDEQIFKKGTYCPVTKQVLKSQRYVPRLPLRSRCSPRVYATDWGPKAYE